MNKNFDYFNIIAEKSRAELMAEARRGYVGLLWWFIEPLLYLSVFYIIFVLVFDRGGREQVLFLLTGLVVWKWIASSIMQGANSVISNAGLMRQIYIPKWIFPIISITTSTLKFFVVLSIFLILLASFNGIHATWVSLPVVLCVNFIFLLGVAVFLSSLVPLIPDLRLIIENSIMLLFFLSGIFFDINLVVSDNQSLLFLNPVLGIIHSYRELLLYGNWPDFSYLLSIVLISVLLALSGFKVLSIYDGQYVKRI